MACNSLVVLTLIAFLRFMSASARREHAEKLLLDDRESAANAIESAESAKDAQSSGTLEANSSTAPCNALTYTADCALVNKSAGCENFYTRTDVKYHRCKQRLVWWDERCKAPMPAFLPDKDRLYPLNVVNCGCGELKIKATMSYHTQRGTDGARDVTYASPATQDRFCADGQSWHARVNIPPAAGAEARFKFDWEPGDLVKANLALCRDCLDASKDGAKPIIQFAQFCELKLSQRNTFFAEFNLDGFCAGQDTNDRRLPEVDWK
eukprot:TRINITY_DN115408_c0_g1_i1.p1 TRINITY_DN115408_c0_g1~~TRINITY_DN115408_c0_g1_i1.p1  ORF type:complete len:265 (-),score=35.21 TRINITY_DN115408_c0_g1_i1:30-824(-)